MIAVDPTSPFTGGAILGFHIDVFRRVFAQFREACAKAGYEAKPEQMGWGVPVYDFKGEREQLRRHVDHRPFDEWAERRYEANAVSIDGLPALVRPK